MTNIWTKRGRVLFGLAGLFLVIAPIIGAQFLIEYHIRHQAAHELAGLASDSVDRANRAIDQGLLAVTELSLLDVTDCSERALDLMRRAVYANFWIKEVGVINTYGHMVCNHIGDTLPVRRLSAPYPTGNPNVTLELAQLGTSDRAGIMLVSAFGKDSLSAIIPSAAITTDLLPKDLRETATGTIAFSDGTPIGTIFGEKASAEGAITDLVTAAAASDRYPVEARLSVPYATFRTQYDGLVTYTNVGGVLIGSLILTLLLYVLLRGHGAELGELREAVTRREFIPYYQPVIDLSTGRLAGCEVLMRWRKPDGTVIPPSGFIALAEATGLAWTMTRSLMQRVRADLEEAFGERPKATISINLFDAHFSSLKTVREVEATFGGSRISYRQLIFEVTERHPLADIARAREVIRGLQTLGSRVALDDAGAGHAGLAYLQQLGVDILKIDKLFVDTIGQRGAATAIVDSLVKLGHDLGLTVVAEGVETPTQLAYLRACGADSAQGYLISPPLPADEFLAYVVARESARDGVGVTELTLAQHRAPIFAPKVA